MVLLKDLARQGHTVIIITHDPRLAEQADRVIEFRDGKVIADRPSKSSEPAPEPGNNNNRLRDLFMNRRVMSRLSGVSEAIRMAMRSLGSNIFRTILTLLGIVIGVASVVAMLAIGEGARQQIVDRISSIGTNMLTLQPARTQGQRMA